MKILPTLIGLSLLAVLSAGVWVLRYRPEWLEPSVVAVEEDEDVNPQKLEIPVHRAKVKTATLHRYIDAFGTVEPAPSRPGRMAGTADVAGPVAGIISQVLIEAGKQVKQGDPLIQLDDRLAVAAEQQAVAALAEAKASLTLKTNPRPEQVELARLKVEQARQAIDFAKRNVTRQEELEKNQGTSEKMLEQARLDLSAAQNGLATAENEQILLKPTPDELAEVQAKIAAAEAALAAAKTQREMLRIVSPIDATVIAVIGNPGESVDTTKVLIDLVALDRLVVNVAIPAQEATTLAAGMSVEISSPRVSRGQIHFVGSEVDRKTGTIPVSIDIDPDLGAKSGQSVSVRIVAEEHKDITAVPKESVVADENGDTFIAMISGDQATHKTVHIGLREGGLVEVQADGLKDGDEIVGGGAYGLAKFQVARVKVLEK